MIYALIIRGQRYCKKVGAGGGDAERQGEIIECGTIFAQQKRESPQIIKQERKEQHVMCIVKNMHRFVTNGVKVFRSASAGRYNEESESVKELKQELMEASSFRQDTANLREDRRRVGHDVRKSFNELILDNG